MAKNLSQPTHDIMFEFDVKVPLRDGVELSANIWRPKAPGKYPVVLMYTLTIPPANGCWAKPSITPPVAMLSQALTSAGVSGWTSYLYWHKDWKEGGGFEGTDVQMYLNFWANGPGRPEKWPCKGLPISRWYSGWALPRQPIWRRWFPRQPWRSLQ